MCYLAAQIVHKKLQHEHPLDLGVVESEGRDDLLVPGKVTLGVNVGLVLAKPEFHHI